jgi:hypothetical protein
MYNFELKWEDHEWEKLNNVTKTCSHGNYDEYGCKCGAWAHRYGIGGPLLSHKDFKPCKTAKSMNPTAKQSDKGYTIGVKVRFTDPYMINSFGFSRDEVYESCEGTDDRYVDDLWFMSPTRNEPIRAFKREYIII